jgi:hypothetical protein
VVSERYGYSRWWAGFIVEPAELISFVMSHRMLREHQEAGGGLGLLVTSGTVATRSVVEAITLAASATCPVLVHLDHVLEVVGVPGPRAVPRGGEQEHVRTGETIELVDEQA